MGSGFVSPAKILGVPKPKTKETQGLGFAARGLVKSSISALDFLCLLSAFYLVALLTSLPETNRVNFVRYRQFKIIYP